MLVALPSLGVAGVAPSPAGADVTFTSPPVASALNNSQSIESSSTFCASSNPNGPFSFRPGFAGTAKASSSMSLPGGSAQYLYVGSDDGGSPQTNVTRQLDPSVTAASTGNPSVSIGRVTRNSGSFTSQSLPNNAIAGLGIAGYSIVGAIKNFASDLGQGTDSGASSSTGASLALQYTVPSNSDVVVMLAGGQGTDLLKEGRTALATLVNDTSSECGSQIVASFGMFAGPPGQGTFTTTFNPTTHPSNTGSSLGVVAFVPAPLSASRLTRPGAPTDVMATTGNGRATVS